MTVEIIERFIDAFSRRDEPALLELAHPDLEFTSLIVEVEGGFHGHAGARRYLQELYATFPDFHVVAADIRPIGDDAIVSIAVRATGAVSGVPTDLADWQAIKVRDGLIAWFGFFRTEAEALAALAKRT
jgi:ketosteroid isomerase-like protein